MLKKLPFLIILWCGFLANKSHSAEGSVPIESASSQKIKIELPIKISEIAPGKFPQLGGDRIYRIDESKEPFASIQHSFGIEYDADIYYSKAALSAQWTSLEIEANKPLKEAIEDALNKDKILWLTNLFQRKKLSVSEIEKIRINLKYVKAMSGKLSPIVNTLSYTNQLNKTPAQLNAEKWTYNNTHKTPYAEIVITLK